MELGGGPCPWWNFAVGGSPCSACSVDILKKVKEADDEVITGNVQVTANVDLEVLEPRKFAAVSGAEGAL